MTSRITWATTLTVSLVALGIAQAQPAAVACKKDETQAECHARLKCKPDEELEACQKRLAAQRAGGNNQGNQGGDDRRDDRGNERDDRGDRGDRGDDRDDDRGGRDRSDRGNRGDRGDRGRDRGDRGDRGNRGRQRGNRGGGRRSFEANKTIGLGLELGEPTGLNGKVFIGPSTAIDFGLGWIYRHYYYGDGAHIYGDVLFHPVSLASNPTLELPFYIGVGLRFWDFTYCVGNVCDYGGSALGFRLPLGIAFDFNNVPLDIFAQIVPVLDFTRGDYYDRYRDRTHLGIDFSLGLRFWFK